MGLHWKFKSVTIKIVQFYNSSKILIYRCRKDIIILSLGLSQLSCKCKFDTWLWLLRWRSPCEEKNLPFMLPLRCCYWVACKILSTIILDWECLITYTSAYCWNIFTRMFVDEINHISNNLISFDCKLNFVVKTYQNLWKYSIVCF